MNCFGVPRYDRDHIVRRRRRRIAVREMNRRHAEPHSKLSRFNGGGRRGEATSILGHRGPPEGQFSAQQALEPRGEQIDRYPDLGRKVPRRRIDELDGYRRRPKLPEHRDQ